MGLIKTAAKVAVASSVHGRVQRRQQQRWAAQDAAQQLQDIPAPAPHAADIPPAAAPVATSPIDDMQRRVDLLRQLGELRDNGVITAAEFDAKKAVLLG